MHRQIGLRDEQSASCIVHHVRHHVNIKVVLPRSFGTSWGSTASMTRSTAPAGSRSCGLGNKFQGVVSGVVGRSMPLTRPGNCVAGCTNPSKRLTNWENTSTPLHPHYPSLFYLPEQTTQHTLNMAAAQGGTNWPKIDPIEQRCHVFQPCCFPCWPCFGRGDPSRRRP